jgi:diguanylate cyclase (GGDEF)-like protein
MPQRVIVHFSPHGGVLPSALRDFANCNRFEIVDVADAGDLLTRLDRASPDAVFLDASHPADAVLAACRTVKAQVFTAIVPVLAYVTGEGSREVADALAAGADEVLAERLSPREAQLRLQMALQRAVRDVSVHPTTRLPGTVQIERDLVERLEAEQTFAVCYADLDHFKEFNDRYGYNHGDRVILILSRILRDVVRAIAPDGFIGHIGGDDFIFTVPFEVVAVCCEEILQIFDELIGLQYTSEDRIRGHFFGKDRRGEMYPVPLMTLSIGVVTNRHRDFSHVAQISELATEMKAYAKSLPGSAYAVDRRGARSRT